VGALANEKVGEYVNENFVASYMKIGTFTVTANGQKQGGNVASYFCLGDGSVLHAIAGPVKAEEFLREARWVNETRKLAMFEAKGNMDKYKQFFRQAHAERMLTDYGVQPMKGSRTLAYAKKAPVPAAAPAAAVHHDAFPDPNDPMAMARVQMLLLQQGRHRGLDNRAQIHVLLAHYPLVKVEQVYKYVFEKILNEKVSTLPVAQNN
jgi:hypothetical protein